VNFKKNFLANIMLPVCILTSTFISCTKAPTTLEIGKLAPEIVVTPADSSQNVHLKDFKGKVVIIQFWQIGCNACLADMLKFKQLRNEIPESKLAIIGINVFGDNDEIKKVQKEFSPNYTVDLKDSLNITARRYQVKILPTIFLLNSNGTAIKKYQGEINLPEFKKDLKDLGLLL
jgi:thiol-disulfide isomerase/thioredoxin